MEDKILKKLEQELKGTDLKLAGYLHCRRNFRITDANDVKKNGLKIFKRQIKTNNDFKLFLHYHYYLGKWAAYQYVLNWLIRNWHAKANKKLAKRFKWF